MLTTNKLTGRIDFLKNRIFLNRICSILFLSLFYQLMFSQLLLAKEDKKLIFFKDIRFSGNVSIPTEKLKSIPVFLSLMARNNTAVSWEELQQVANHIEQYYQKNGFPNTKVEILVQQEEGIVEFQIAEGKSEAPQNSLGQPRVTDRTIDDKKDLSRFLNRPEEIYGKKEHPYRLIGEINNYGPRSTGRKQYGVTFQHKNLLGRHDQLTQIFQKGRGLQVFVTDYLMPLKSDWDTSLGMTYTNARVKIGGDLKDLNIQGNATIYGTYLLKPVIKKPNFQTTLKAGFDWNKSQIRVLGNIVGRQVNRIINTGIYFEQQDSKGKTYFPHEFRFGVGSSDEKQFFVYKGSLSRYQKLIGDLVLAFRETVQLTPERVESERIEIGGESTVRGYQQAEFSGDFGVHMSLELLLPTYIFPRNWKMPFSNKAMRDQIQFMGFYDFGYAGVHAPVEGEKKDRFLAGAGGGLRINLLDSSYATFEWAVPIAHAVPMDNRRSAFYFGVSMDVFDLLPPWKKKF